MSQLSIFFTFNLDPDGEWDLFETKTLMQKSTIKNGLM